MPPLDELRMTIAFHTPSVNDSDHDESIVVSNPPYAVEGRGATLRHLWAIQGDGDFAMSHIAVTSADRPTTQPRVFIRGR